MKTCTKCKEEKPFDAFSKTKQNNDGLKSWCKPCCSKEALARYYLNAEKNQERSRVWKKDNRDLICETNFHWRKTEKGAISEMLSQARKRAKKDNVPFNLTPEDIQIPELCPVLLKPLVRKVGKGPSPWSPSLDKIIPSKGYVVGNVMIMSHRANVMKNAATPEELLLFATWVNKTFTGDFG